MIDLRKPAAVVPAWTIPVAVWAGAAAGLLMGRYQCVQQIKRIYLAGACDVLGASDPQDFRDRFPAPVPEAV